MNVTRYLGNKAYITIGKCEIMEGTNNLLVTFDRDERITESMVVNALPGTTIIFDSYLADDKIKYVNSFVIMEISVTNKMMVDITRN